MIVHFSLFRIILVMRPLLILVSFAILLQFSYCLDEGTLGTFWHNQAHFEFISTFSFETPGEPNTAAGNVGTYMVIVGDIWYLFYRELHYLLTPINCKFFLTG